MKTEKYGMSGTTLLQIAFIVLKLTHVIDWSWVWVLAPMWISAIIAVVIIVIQIIAEVKK